MTPSVAAPRRVVLLAGLTLLCACHGDVDPSPAMAEELVARLDAAVNDASRQTYHSLFAAATEPRWLGGPAAERIHRLLAHQGRVRQRSRVTAFERVGEVGVALTETTIGGAGEAGRDLVSHSYLVFRGRGGEPRATLLVDVDPDARAGVSAGFTGVFHCPACNFSIGLEGHGWLVVPSPRGVSGCTEMVSFYDTASDLRMTVTVTSNPDRLPADSLLREIVANVTATSAAVTAWIPLGVDDPNHEVRGARTEVQSGEDVDALHVVTRSQRDAAAGTSEVAYLLTATARRTTHQTHAAAIRAWLASFMLDDAERPPGDVAAAAATEHSGGWCKDGEYRNQRYRVRCQGPGAWHARAEAEGCLFHIGFVCPQQRGTVSLTGYRSPPGNLARRQQMAVAMLRDRGGQPRPDFDAPDGARWQAPPDPNPWGAEAVLQLSSPAGGAAPAQACTVLLYADLWLVVDGEIRDAAALPAYDAVVRSVQRF